MTSHQGTSRPSTPQNNNLNFYGNFSRKLVAIDTLKIDHQGKLLG
jgi:hypothetical protein